MTLQLTYGDPDRLVLVEGAPLDLLRRCDGSLVTKVYSNTYGAVVYYTPQWAYDTACVASIWRSRRGAFFKLIRCAKRNADVRDALLAALDAGSDLVVQLAVLQAKREP